MPLAINQIMSDIKFLNEDELIELNQFIVGLNLDRTWFHGFGNFPHQVDMQ